MSPMRSLVRPAVAAVLLAAAAAAPSGAGSAAAEEPPAAFWAEREAAYRASPRGPFTAVQAFYVERGEEIVLRAGTDSVSAGESGAVGDAALPAARVAWKADGFHLAPVAGTAGPTAGGEPVAGARLFAEGADDAEDVRLGRFLLSLGAQTEELGRIVVYDPARLDDFHGFAVFADADAFRVRAMWAPGDGAAVELGTSRGLVKSLRRAAVLSFELGERRCTLTGFREAGTEGPLFVPFRDATSGQETYGVGRYLRVDPQPDGTAVIDFNRATNPWCAYSPFYNCILPPAENELDVPVRAGERTPPGH